MNPADFDPLIAVDEQCYRNIATCHPSQSLFDDIVDSEDEYKILIAWENASSGIDHLTPQPNRIFQYSDISSSVAAVFQKTNWNPSRFTDGTFGVWYAGLSQETSLQETLYWIFKNFYESTLEQKKKPVAVHRRMFEAQVKTQAGLDLRSRILKYPDIKVDDHSFCRSLGKFARDKNIESYLYPSVRHADGSCVAVFDPIAISEDHALNHFRFIFFPGPERRVEVTNINLTIAIPDSWIER
jgi:hypothetical protein